MDNGLTSSEGTNPPQYQYLYKLLEPLLPQQPVIERVQTPLNISIVQTVRTLYNLLEPLLPQQPVIERIQTPLNISIVQSVRTPSPATAGHRDQRGYKPPSISVQYKLLEPLLPQQLVIEIREGTNPPQYQYLYKLLEPLLPQQPVIEIREGTNPPQYQYSTNCQNPFSRNSRSQRGYKPPSISVQYNLLEPLLPQQPVIEIREGTNPPQYQYSINCQNPFSRNSWSQRLERVQTPLNISICTNCQNPFSRNSRSQRLERVQTPLNISIVQTVRTPSPATAEHREGTNPPQYQYLYKLLEPLLPQQPVIKRVQTPSISVSVQTVRTPSPATAGHRDQRGYKHPSISVQYKLLEPLLPQQPVIERVQTPSISVQLQTVRTPSPATAGHREGTNPPQYQYSTNCQNPFSRNSRSQRLERVQTPPQYQYSINCQNPFSRNSRSQRGYKPPSISVQYKLLEPLLLQQPVIERVQTPLNISICTNCQNPFSRNSRSQRLERVQTPLNISIVQTVRTPSPATAGHREGTNPPQYQYLYKLLEPLLPQQPVIEIREGTNPPSISVQYKLLEPLLLQQPVIERVQTPLSISIVQTVRTPSPATAGHREGTNPPQYQYSTNCQNPFSRNSRSQRLERVQTPPPQYQYQYSTNCQNPFSCNSRSQRGYKPPSISVSVQTVRTPSPATAGHRDQRGYKPPSISVSVQTVRTPCSATAGHREGTNPPQYQYSINCQNPFSRNSRSQRGYKPPSISVSVQTVRTPSPATAGHREGTNPPQYQYLYKLLEPLLPQQPVIERVQTPLNISIVQTVRTPSPATAGHREGKNPPQHQYLYKLLEYVVKANHVVAEGFSPAESTPTEHVKETWLPIE